MKIQPVKRNQVLDKQHAFAKLVENETYLSGFLFEDMVIQKLEPFHLRIDGCMFINVVFEDCDFDRIDIMDTTFTRCEFVNVTMRDGSLHRNEFVSGRYMGLSILTCSLKELLMKDLNARYINIADCKLTNVYFTHCDFESASFTACEYKKTIYEDCNLMKSEFHNTSLCGVDLSSSSIEGISISPQGIRGVIVNVQQALVLSHMLGIIIKEEDR